MNSSWTLHHKAVYKVMAANGTKTKAGCHAEAPCIRCKVLRTTVWLAHPTKLLIHIGQGSLPGNLWRIYGWSDENPVDTWRMVSHSRWIPQSVELPTHPFHPGWGACRHPLPSRVKVPVLQLQGVLIHRPDGVGLLRIQFHLGRPWW